MNEQITILHAEDDDGHAFLIKKSLRTIGFHNEIRRFYDGAEILGYLENNYQNARQGKYIVLLDVKMPKLSGDRVLAEIRNNNSFQKLPVIVISTCENPDVIDRCHQIGCNAYLTKPVNDDLLKREIDDAIRSVCEKKKTDSKYMANE